MLISSSNRNKWWSLSPSFGDGLSRLGSLIDRAVFCGSFITLSGKRYLLLFCKKLIRRVVYDSYLDKVLRHLYHSCRHCLLVCRVSLLLGKEATLVAILATIAVGFIGGPSAIGGFLLGNIVSGLLLSLFMSNAGGLWDNSKKYVE